MTILTLSRKSIEMMIDPATYIAGEVYLLVKTITDMGQPMPHIVIKLED